MITRAAWPLCLLAAVAGCSAGGSDDGAPIVVRDVPPELVFCRSRREAPHSATEIRTATRQGLDDRTAVPDRAGLESGVRVNPDGVTVVFARERRADDPDSSEIYTASLDGSRPEARLTADGRADHSPCWIDGGAQLAFVSTRDGIGTARLWTMDADGQNPALLFDDGSEQRDPDERGGRLVFSRRDPLLGTDAAAELWVIELSSGVATRWTDGGGSRGGGDREPAWSPDGGRILFTRTTTQGGARLLHTIDVATRSVALVGDTFSDHSLPRWSPSGDSIFVARSSPGQGLAGLRLWELAADGGEAALVIPDQRFDCVGIDVLPALTARPTLGAEESVPLDRATAVTTFGVGNVGSSSALERADGLVVTILTGLFDRRDVAGLRVTIPLPVDDPLDVGRIDIEVSAAISRIDGDAVLRLTLDNFGANRNDTVLERQPLSTRIETYAFTSQSLAHLDRDGRLTLTIIADLPEGARAELSVDHVAVSYRRR